MAIIPSLIYLTFRYCSVNVNFSALKAHCSFRRGKKRIVSAHADISAWKKFSAALPHKDRAGLRYLARIELDSSILSIAVSAVPGGTLSFFMCHNKSPLIINFTCRIPILHYSRGN